MAPSLIVMVGEAVVVSATHGGLYLLIHCSIAQWAHSGRVFWLNKYTQYTHWTKNPDFAHCALWHTDDVKLHNVSKLRQNVQVQHSDIPRLWRGLSVSCWTKLVRSWRRVFVTLSVVIIRQPAIMLPAKPSSTPVSTGCDSILSLQAGCRPLKFYHLLPSY